MQPVRLPAELPPWLPEPLELLPLEEPGASILMPPDGIGRARNGLVTASSMRSTGRRDRKRSNATQRDDERSTHFECLRLWQLHTARTRQNGPMDEEKSSTRPGVESPSAARARSGGRDSRRAGGCGSGPRRQRV